MATGEWRMDVSLVMGPIFRAPYDAGRLKHRQHLINHNLSQIRIHYHQQAGGPFLSAEKLCTSRTRVEASCSSRRFWERKRESRMYGCHGKCECPRCQGDCSDRGWNLGKPGLLREPTETGTKPSITRSVDTEYATFNASEGGFILHVTVDI